MANFAQGGFSRGYAAGNPGGTSTAFANVSNAISNRQRVKLEQQQQAAARQQQAQQRYADSRDKLMEGSLKAFNEITSAAEQAEKSGNLSEDQRSHFRELAGAALLSTLTTLQQDAALAVQRGAQPGDPFLAEVQHRQQMLASQASVFDARVDAARDSYIPPKMLGARKAQEQAAQVRELASELSMDEKKVAEGLGFIEGEPAPTELEKTERALRLLDADGAPDDDPRRLRILGRLTQLTTPSVADIISPLIQKMARGEPLTPEEQKALDAAQRLSFTDQLMRGLMGGAASLGTPQYKVDPETGALVAQ